MDWITLSDMAPKKEVSLSIRLDIELLGQIQRRATNYNTSRAAVIRQLIEEGLKAQLKLLPSATALEKELSTLNKKLDRIAEAMHEYGKEPPGRAPKHAIRNHEG